MNEKPFAPRLCAGMPGVLFMARTQKQYDKFYKIERIAIYFSITANAIMYFFVLGVS
jgi:hypothetical protein